MLQAPSFDSFDQHKTYSTPLNIRPKGCTWKLGFSGEGRRVQFFLLHLKVM